MTEEDFMRRAIELAKGGIGRVNPNPLVGAVIVKDGVIIGEGFHEKYGELHAERNAIKSAVGASHDSIVGATIYVTLEPCCHTGKQPPCVDAIIESGIKKVVVGSRDPNPLVSGKGNARLREAGIEVVEDFLKEECDALNPVFFHYIKTKTPYVAIKYAMTADGKIATVDFDSKWVTGEAAREEVQKLRNKYSAILVGANTAISDNPTLNCRIEGGRNPIRLILDSELKILRERSEGKDICENIFSTAKDIPTYFVCKKDVSVISTGAKRNGEILQEQDLHSERCLDYARHDTKACARHDTKNSLQDDSFSTIEVGVDENGKIDLVELMEKLGEMKIDSVLVEGGGLVNASFLEKGLVNKIYAFVAPKVLGCGGIEPFRLPRTKECKKKMSEAVEFELENVSKIGDDVLIEMVKKPRGFEPPTASL